jgi:OFA family oxalate/formate antiporter-like MFS transporter
MEQKTMNRWIIVIGAILIQLCLGAIYAWSVFTTPLVAPLPDDNFQSDMGTDIVVDVEGDLIVGEPSDMNLTFTRDGEVITDFESVIVFMELTDENNKPVEADKVIPFLGIVYEEGSPITAGPWNATLMGSSYAFSTEADSEKDIKGISHGGNWHFLINATETHDGNTTTYNYDVLDMVNTGKFGYSKAQTQLIFAAGLFTFALFTIFGGRLAARFGPRNIAIAGGAVLGAGYILASFVGTSFVGLIFTIGVMGGAGIGLAYVVPIAVGVKWFPDMKGLISGLAVAGFGFGALLWIKLCRGFEFGPINLTPGWNGLFGYEGIGVSQVFLIYGIAFAVIVILGGLIMINPPEGWTPKGYKPPEASDKKASGNVEFTSKEMIKTPQYWMLFVMFMIGAGAGLMVIGIIQLFGKDALVENGYTSAEAVTIAGTAMALFYSLSNGFGRIAWGAISDKIGRRWAFVSMFGIQGLIMILFYFIGGNEYLLYLGAALIGFNFGGNFALFPSATADFFGNKSVGLNYGFVFFSYGIGGILGPMLGGIMGDLNLWLWAFLPAGICLFISAVLAFLLKQPSK